MLRYVLRSTLAVVLIVGLGNLALAQYGGGGMPGSPTYTHRSYSSKGAIMGGVAGGAAAVGDLLLLEAPQSSQAPWLCAGKWRQAGQREGPSDLQPLEPAE